MNPIQPPLRQGDQGLKVTNLQEALLFLLSKAPTRFGFPDARSAADLATKIEAEKADSVFKDATQGVVVRFQGANQLDRSGIVDDPTAKALNVLLKELGAFPEVPVTETGSDELSLGKSGTRVGEVQKGLGQLGYAIPQQEGAEAVFGLGTQSAIRRFQDAMGLTVSGRVDARTLAELDRALAEQGQALWRVEGRLFHEHGGPAEGVKLRLQQVLFGGKTQRLTEQEITTDALGYFSVTYAPTTEKVLLTVLAVGADGNEVALSQPVIAQRREVLNLVLPAKLQPASDPEFQRLAAALQPHLGAGRLAAAREDGDQHDLSLLHQATGWDARVLALAAHADRLAAEPELTAAGLGGEALYALVRAGLPTDTGRLAIESEEAVEAALKLASAAGIVRLADGDIATAKQAFRKFADEKRLGLRAPGALSTTGDMLKASGLAETEKAGFTRAYARHLRSGADLWAEARREGVPEAQIAKLQVQGKLAYLTQNHQPLVEKLMTTVTSLAPDDISGLIDHDYHEAGTWQSLYAEVAGVTGRETTEELELKLASVRPPAYETATAAAAVAAASADQARQLRIAYPTQVARRVIEKDAADNNRLGLRIVGQRTPVYEVLHRAQKLPGGFELGSQSVDGFIKRHKAALFPGETETEIAATTQGLRTLQRVYQISPTVEAMGSLLSLGFKSARDVTRFSKADFVRAHAHRLAGPEEAALIYDKATQVSVVTFNFFALAQQARNGLATRATHTLQNIAEGSEAAEKPEERNSVMMNLFTQFPTLETLIGEQDYAECQGCESVLSPSAYFVDLLEFLNPNDLVWNNFLAVWQHTHLDVAYGRPKPFDALMQRRPDLQHLPLTCENTETVLPYIDVVNEILEYSVVNGSLDPHAAHDTGQARSDELIAEPQNLIAGAYDKLKTARYPLNLPFDLWLETVRRFFQHQGTTLVEAMDALCPTELLHDNGASFDRAAVAIESLCLSQSEASVLTDPAILQEWFKLYGYETAPIADAVLRTAGVPNAKLLSRKLGVSYKELAALVQTEFLNPALKPAGFLHRLGLEFNDLRRLKQPLTDPQAEDDRQKAILELQKRIEAVVTELFQPTADAMAQQGKSEAEIALALAPAIADAKAKATVAEAALDLTHILVLSDSDTNASFDQTMLRFADATGTPVTELALLKLNLFVRLWRKLGWSLEDTDRALCLFVGDPATLSDFATLGEAMHTALLYLARIQKMLTTLSLGAKGLSKLLTFWTDLPTRGRQSLYARLFLNRAVLRNDPVFDHPLGAYLSDPNVPLNAHLPAVQGALGLSADDIARLVADAPATLSAENLSLPAVSCFYRHAVLAKALKLSVAEVIALKAISGLDPFAAPLATGSAVTTLAKDEIWSQTLPFIELAAMLRERGLKVAELDGLLRHRYADDSNDKPRPEAGLALTQTLAAGQRQIAAEHALPESVDAAWLLPRLSLLLPADLATEIIALCFGTAEFEVSTVDDVEPANQIPAADFANEPALRLGYSAVRKHQRLAWRGYLTSAKAAALKATVLPASAGTTLGKLIDDIRAGQGQAFAATIKRALSLLQARTDVVVSADMEKAIATAAIDALLDDAEFATQQQTNDAVKELRGLFSELFADGDLDPPFVHTDNARRSFAEAWRPLIVSRAVRQFIGTTLTTELAGDSALTTLLLYDKDRLHLASDHAKTLGDIFMEAGTTAELLTLDGYFQVPTSGPYRLTLNGLTTANSGSIVIDGHTVFDKNTGDTTVTSNVVDLRAGSFVRCQIQGVAAADPSKVTVLIQGEILPLGSLDRLPVYSEATVDLIGKALLALSKALRFVQSSAASEAELRFAWNRPVDFAGLSLSGLPLSENDPVAAPAPELLKQWQGLVRLAQAKQPLAVEEPTVLAILNADGAAPPWPLLAALLACDGAKISKVATHLGVSAPLSADSLLRLWRALRMVARLGGVDENALDGDVVEVLKWVDPTPTAIIARDVRNAAKARVDLDTWAQVAQPIFDPLRQLQRDALVAFLLHHENLQRVEQLYEVFLLDPSTEPVVQTSRMALAIASVQHFIQRCFLNLEPEVHPTTLDSVLWKWMKSIALWGAGRRIFIHPENYLQPEFRDDKTHLFQELEGKLLQGNVTTDLAEEAFHTYLQGLAEISKMEMVTMHCEQHPDPRKNVVHLIGRVPNAAQKYFYRRSAHGVWTPWEPMSVSMEGEHITAIVWRGRLQLFWLTFLPAGGQSDEAKNTTFEGMRNQRSSALIQRKEKVQLNWSEYYQGKWSARKFGQGDAATLEFNVSAEFKRSQIFIHASKESNGKGGDGAVWVNLRVKDLWTTQFGGGTSIAKMVSSPSGSTSSGRPDITGDLDADLTFYWPEYQVSDYGFKLISKLAPPIGNRSGAPGLPASPYAATLGNHPTKLTGAVKLAVTVNDTIVTTSGVVTSGAALPHQILGSPTGFQLLPCTHPAPFPDAEIAALTAPFFYEDAEAVFFVEPTLVDKTVYEWRGWGRPWEWPGAFQAGGLVLSSKLIPYHPEQRIVPERLVDPLGPAVKNAVIPQTDWVTHPAASIHFNGQNIGRTGSRPSAPISSGVLR